MAAEAYPNARRGAARQACELPNNHISANGLRRMACEQDYITRHTEQSSTCPSVAHPAVQDANLMQALEPHTLRLAGMASAWPALRSISPKN